MTVRQGLLSFKVELTDQPQTVTSHAALPLVVEAMRAVFSNRFYRKLSKALGWSSWQAVRRHVESLVLLVVAGGEHIEDLDVLRADTGLARLLGFEVSGRTQAKEFLYAFHQAADGRRLTPQDDAALSRKGKARIREEGPGLLVLGSMLQRLTEVIQRIRPRDRATLDVDATIIEAHKEQALMAYEGTVGYQPQDALWAEQGIWVRDQFRDGNVPAEYRVKDFLVSAVGALPSNIRSKRLRGDTALYNEEALSWTDDEEIEFAVSADMSPPLTEAIESLPEESWEPYKSFNEKAEANEERQWAEVVYVPDWLRNRHRQGEAFRYIGIRIRARQRGLFDEDEPQWRHFAVVTNMDWRGDRLLRWQREKQGTVEHANGVTKNDLGGGVMPCGRFGSNAAWWRLNVLVHNLLELLKDGLPDRLSQARPKTLRYRLFNVSGRLIWHARCWVVKVSSLLPLAGAYVAARRWLVDLQRSLRGPPTPAEV